MAEWIEHSNVSMMLNKVDDEEKASVAIYDGRQNRNMITINESGLYSLVLRSKLPQAKKFRRWVTSEVLPQIRKTGGYIPMQEGESEAEILAKALIIVQTTLELKDRELAEKNNKILQDAPKVHYYDTVLSSDNSHCIAKEEIFNGK